jgi:hypothetical protein
VHFTLAGLGLLADATVRAVIGDPAEYPAPVG